MVGYWERFPSLTRWGVLGMSRGSTPRHAQTAGDLSISRQSYPFFLILGQSHTKTTPKHNFLLCCVQKIYRNSCWFIKIVSMTARSGEDMRFHYRIIRTGRSFCPRDHLNQSNLATHLHESAYLCTIQLVTKKRTWRTEKSIYYGYPNINKTIRQ